MENSNEEITPQQEHTAAIYKEYTTSSRVLQSFANLSNTVIQTALNGASKFIFEILQNTDDAFEDPNKSIEVKFILQDNYLIVHHNGKGFDFNDVERICDYASQIKEVKATDLSKTGYKGLGFKSLFNLSDCIYIYSNGYSFRFDKAHWTDPENKPWQVIPIWCGYDELPLKEKYSYDQPVNFILSVNNVSQIESQVRELVHQPELLLFLHRINKISVNLNDEKYYIERREEKFGAFHKIDFHKNQHVESTWLKRVYSLPVPIDLHTCIWGASQFIYPDKIKNAKKVSFTFALRSDKTLVEISMIRGLCYNTLPTKLHLTLPYHINSLFILNLDRMQLHENEWNEFLIYQIGYQQLNFLKDLAEVDNLKNYVIQLLVRKINHPYVIFSKAFLKGFMEAKGKIAWLPSHQEVRLLKLGEAWTDQIEFFKQNFQKIRDHRIYPYLINYDVKSQNYLSFSEAEAKHFTYDQLFRDFPNKYYSQLTRIAYINFITYLHKRLNGPPINFRDTSKLKSVPFLVAKDKTLLSPKNALLEDSENPIPDFLMLYPIDNEYLPLNNIDLIKDWLVFLGARRLTTPIEVLRESVLKWIDSGDFGSTITLKNHIGIINYIAKGIEHLNKKEMDKLKERLLILTESSEFKLAKVCYLPDAVSTKELANIISDEEKISSSYDMNSLKGFFIHVGVQNRLNPADVLRKSILMWMKNGKINDKLTTKNYKPIIEFIALNYTTLEHDLTEPEKMELKEMPVLTYAKTFQKARDCYFDSAKVNVKGLEGVIAKNKLILTDVPKNVYKFLKKIGVSKEISSTDVIRRSVLKWIQEDDTTNRITHDNHHAILKYICEQWDTLNSSSGLKPKEKKELKRMPVLTESGAFRAAYNCYWSVSTIDGSDYEEIPGLESVIPSDQFVSSIYRLKEIKRLLEDFGVHDLGFTDIYEKYSDHLTHRENVKWFFCQLVNYWKRYKANKNQLLSCLQQKFHTSSCLLAKNGKMYSSTELYSSRFDVIHDVDPYSILLLEYEKLPEDLEMYLGFKTELDIKCIKQLLKAIGKKTELGKEKTRQFFVTLLEQLREKDENEIRKYQLSLLSKKNELRLAKDLYYFIEEDVTCHLDSCYLKRIPGMSHDETLELAELCGVNILPFEKEIKREEKIYDNTLKEFYLERLPFIVIQESKQLNEDVHATLSRLYGMISAIKLYKCRKIFAKYSFGDPIKIPHHFEDVTFYIVGKWVNKKSTIRDYLSKKLGLETDIRDIIDMEQPITENDKQEWLSYQKDLQKFYLVEEELKKLLSSEEKREFDALPSDVSVEIRPHHSEGELDVLSPDVSVEIQPHHSEEKGELDILPPDVNVEIQPHHSEEKEKLDILPPDVGVEIQSHHSEEKGKLDILHPVVSVEILPHHSKEKEKLEILPPDVSVEIQPHHFEEKGNLDILPPDVSVEIQPHHFEEKGNLDILHPDVSVEILPHHSKEKEKLDILPPDVSVEIQPHHSEEKGNLDILPPVVSVVIQPHYSEYEEKHFKDSKLLVSKELTTAESCLGESSADRVEDEACLKMKYAIKNDGSGVYDTATVEPEIITCYESTTDSFVGKDIIEVNVRSLDQSELRTDHKNRIQQLKIPGNYSSMESLHTGSSRFSQEAGSEKSHIKWLREKYVFTYLQDHYKNKYPNSQSNLSDGIFTLWWRSHKMEIVWLNDSGEKGESYDMLLRKQGEVKRLIEVESTNDVLNDSFNISHCNFIRKINHLAAEFPDHKEKYCIYRVFNTDNSSTSSVEELNSSSALYKVVSLKNPYIFQGGS